MKTDWLSKLGRLWVDAGWISLACAVLFLVSYLRGNENYLFLSGAFFVVSLIQLFFKYKNKIFKKNK